MERNELVLWASLLCFFVGGFFSFAYMDSDGWLAPIVFILWAISGIMLYVRFEWFRKCINWILAFLLAMYLLDLAEKKLKEGRK